MASDTTPTKSGEEESQPANIAKTAYKLIHGSYLELEVVISL